ncbi:MAG: diguanylate cyclase (GGDEF)-like protein [Gammaproteobacteria bacterium]|jgi:diguanylate cyclase (GGDEF)-like protein
MQKLQILKNRGRLLNLRRGLSEKHVYVYLFLAHIAFAFLCSTFTPEVPIVSLSLSAGVGLSGCILMGLRFLPAIFIGSLIFNSVIQFGSEGVLNAEVLLLSAGMGLGSTLQAYVNYKILKKRSLDVLDSPSAQNILIFILAAFISCTISAVIGNFILTSANSEWALSLIEWDNVWAWWVGDFLGVIFFAPLILCFFQGQESSSRILFKGVVAPLLIIIALFHFFQQYMEEDILATGKVKFELMAKAAENNLKRKMSEYLKALDELEQQISHGDMLTKEEFAQTVGDLTNKVHGIKAMSWNPIVEQRDVAEFERISRESVSSDFRIKGQPLTSSDPLVVVQLIEPLTENMAALGFNVFSNSARKQAMLNAHRTNSAVATDVIQLMQSDKMEPGFLIFKPVMTTVQSNDQSQGALHGSRVLKGYAVGVFMASQVIQESLDDKLIQFLDSYVYENGNTFDKVLGNEEILEEVAGDMGLTYKFDLNFANHQWGVYFHINGADVTGLQVGKTRYYKAIETIFGALAVFIVLSAFGGHEQLRQQFKARTKELERLNTKLEEYAFYDSLTGLPNRRLFIDRLGHAQGLAARSKQKLALIFMDLNGFKQVNDRLGHECGDQLLMEVARRFARSVRKSDTLARFGGDEFTVLVESNPGPGALRAISTKLTESLCEPIYLSGEPIVVSVSIGISLFPQDGEQFVGLLRCADAAMYKAKELGIEMCFYSKGWRSEAS